MDRAHWSYKDEARDAKQVAEVWDQVFQGALGPLPDVLHSPCCAGALPGLVVTLLPPSCPTLHVILT